MRAVRGCPAKAPGNRKAPDGCIAVHERCKQGSLLRYSGLESAHAAYPQILTRSTHPGVFGDGREIRDVVSAGCGPPTRVTRIRKSLAPLTSCSEDLDVVIHVLALVSAGLMGAIACGGSYSPSPTVTVTGAVIVTDALTDGVADAVTRADAAGPGGERPSRFQVGAQSLGNQGLHTARTERRRGHDGDVDEYRLCFPHDDIGCHRVELGNSRARPSVLIRVSGRRNLSMALTATFTREWWERLSFADRRI